MERASRLSGRRHAPNSRMPRPAAIPAMGAMWRDKLTRTAAHSAAVAMTAASSLRFTCAAPGLRDSRPEVHFTWWRHDAAAACGGSRVLRGREGFGTIKPAMDDRELLRHIGRLPGGKAGYKQLVRELGLGGGQERRELREQLGRLTGRRQLTQIDGQHWAIPQAAPTSDKRESGGRGAVRAE